MKEDVVTTSPPKRKQRMKLVVIHGWGGRFADAVTRVLELFAFEAFWDDGAFCTDRRLGSLVRQVLGDTEPSLYVVALQKLIVSRFLDAITEAKPGTYDRAAHARFSESRLLRDFAGFGIPLAPADRAQRARELRDDAKQALDQLLIPLQRLQDELTPSDGVHPAEAEARKLILDVEDAGVKPDALLELLEPLRDMHESGGDLDTVSSGALYGYALASGAEGKPLIYGQDYRFVFVNYHESLERIAELGPADLYMADLPIGAFPAFDSNIRYLAEHDVHAARFEDHHPYTAAQEAMLKKLQADGLLDFLSLSGPLLGEELEPGTEKCACDMVYESMVQGKPWDSAGARRLREAAHAEDLVAGDDDLGKLLTILIKGGICKVELAQLLVASLKGNDAERHLSERGWDTLAQEWKAATTEIEDNLLECTHVIRIPRMSGEDVQAGEESHIVVSLAPRPKHGEPRLNVAKAVEFFSRRLERIDYLFYCYGSSLMVTRRVNQDDLTLNLGQLVAGIGTESDGGHSGAATCRPDSNPSYPGGILRRVDRANFNSFVRYLGDKLTELGHPTHPSRNVSVRPSESRSGGRKLLYVLGVALLLGLVLMAVHPAFRREAVLESNADFFPQLDAVPTDKAEAKP